MPPPSCYRWPSRSIPSCSVAASGGPSPCGRPAGRRRPEGHVRGRAREPGHHAWPATTAPWRGRCWNRRPGGRALSTSRRRGAKPVCRRRGDRPGLGRRPGRLLARRRPRRPLHPKAAMRRVIADVLAHGGPERWDHLDEDYVGFAPILWTVSSLTDRLGGSQAAAVGTSKGSRVGSAHRRKARIGGQSPPSSSCVDRFRDRLGAFSGGRGRVFEESSDSGSSKPGSTSPPGPIGEGQDLDRGRRRVIVDLREKRVEHPDTPHAAGEVFPRPSRSLRWRR